MARRAGASTALAGLALAVFALPAISQTLPGPGLAPAAAAARSLALPGWGQWAQGQRRSVGYAAMEAVLWVFWADRRGDGSELRGAYRDLAWLRGRIPSGERRDPAWAYYETLSKWSRSGAFDRDASVPGLQPEEDPATFNGSIWALARGIHFGGGSPAPGDPAWEAALAWYRERAYGDGYLWDWSGREGDLAEYRGLIRKSDDRFREATAALGAVLANHLLSGADAFVSARIPGSAEVRLFAPATPRAAMVWLTLSWSPPK
jgi:hypothetical protein